jgi:hypothetical protein
MATVATERTNMFKKIKKIITKYIEDLAKENEKSFGKDKLDCCNLNKNEKNNS